LFKALLLLFVLFASCTSSPNSRGPVITASSNTAPGTRVEAAPEWTRDPYTRYSSREYLAAVGTGSSRQDAERNALGNLIAQFGQSIHVDERISTTYQEAVRGGVSMWSELTNAETIIALSTSLDTLIGAEIGEAWFGSGTHYVAAILNRGRAIRTYTDMTEANLAMIDYLTAVPEMERNTFNGYARYQFAAAIADVTLSYGNLLGQLGAPIPGLVNGDRLRLEAASILANIPILISVRREEDPTGRIQGAFARALSSLGFQSGGINPRYILEVGISLTPVDIPGNSYIFSRIEISANLRDSLTNTILLPFNFNTREGHTSQAESDNRAILVAERRIYDDYTVQLNNYLGSLLPGN